MKTLYVTDLDGTLLRSDERTSDFTNETINRLVEQGLIFSYATARSYQTAHKVTKGLNASFPLIIYNGTMVIDNKSGDFLIKNFFGSEITDVIADLIRHGVFPIVYAFIDGVEKFSYIPQKCSAEMKVFLDSRKNDRRSNPVAHEADLTRGGIFYVTCIDSYEKLKPLYQKYAETYHCIFQEDIYTNHQWFEIMPKAASKANAVRQLKAHLGCRKVVAFGDGKNDIDMFEMADEAYAVSNAVEELKQLATNVIGSNNEDGVAKWLCEFAEIDHNDGYSKKNTIC